MATSPSITQLVLDYLLHEQAGQIAVVCLLLLGLIWILDNGPKSKLATGRWGGAREKAAARFKAHQQMWHRVFNKVALYIVSPRYQGDKRPLYFPDLQRGLLTVGAPGVGKTESCISPLVRSSLEQGYPVILLDGKYPTESSRHAAYARHLGYDVKVFAPGFPESEICNILDFLKDGEDGEMAAQLAKVLDKNFRKSTRDSDPYFEEAGQQLIQAALQLAKTTLFSDLLMVGSILILSDLGKRVEAASDMNPFIRMAFMSLRAVKESEKTVASIAGTATNYFQRFINRRIINSFVGKTSFPLDMQGRQLLILGLDKEKQEALSPLIAVVLHLMVTRNVSQRRHEPLIVVLDELPTIHVDVVKWLNWYRENGLVLILGIQNIAQLEQSYGKEAARSIVGACSTKVLFNPGEVSSAKLLSDLLGDQVILERQRSKTRGRRQRSTSISEQHRVRKLFEPSQFLRLPPGKCILLSPGHRSKGEIGIPLKVKITIPTTETRKSEVSVKRWPQLRRWLIQQRQHREIGPTDIEQRMALAETLLPPITSSPIETAAQLGQLGKDLENSF
ncbi:type IV secretory pathway, VirD4 component [Leptolyngbya sp. PCC 7375]|nr:type IV secretory pathway, VirD4 component [Leptolyngbya sp. PCC 7375]